MDSSDDDYETEDDDFIAIANYGAMKRPPSAIKPQLLPQSQPERARSAAVSGKDLPPYPLSPIEKYRKAHNEQKSKSVSQVTHAPFDDSCSSSTPTNSVSNTIVNVLV